jgi:hypothetical protein
MKELGSSTEHEFPTLVCDAYVKRADGSSYAATLSGYLESTKPLFAECWETVNTELKDIFRNTTESAKVREELRASLGNVCAEYVEMFSIVARMRKEEEPLEMCDLDALITATVKDRDFCAMETSETESSTLSTLISFGYPNYSRTLIDLMGLGDDCPAKCGEGYGRILCNAYYSMTTVLANTLQPSVSDNEANKVTASEFLE